MPLLLGGRARVAVYTTQVFNTARMPTDWGLASTYSMVLLLLAMGLLYVHFRVVRHGGALPDDPVKIFGRGA